MQFEFNHQQFKDYGGDQNRGMHRKSLFKRVSEFHARL